MLSLILLPITLMIELIVLPWKILGHLMRSSWFWGIAFLCGLFSLLGGIISGLFGLVRGILPIALVVAGIALIISANKKEPEAAKEAFDSFYTARQEQNSSQS